jgi:hypothetical protein
MFLWVYVLLRESIARKEKKRYMLLGDDQFFLPIRLSGVIFPNENFADARRSSPANFYGK